MFNELPKGWISIEEHLPEFKITDKERGLSCTKYLVKNESGIELETCVSDSYLWYYIAKEFKITHWFNE